MGSQPSTVVSLNGTQVGTIGAGETLRLADIQRGDVVTTSNPAQATLITGDVGSTYEMRWYALAPREQWSDDYYTPVYTPTGEEATRVWLYNPNDDPITVTMSTATNATFQSIVVPAGQSVLSNAVPDAPGPGGSGARFFTANGADFFALTQTDTGASGSTGGQIFDWGHPLIPADQLTSQALIGLGYGTTSNEPGRSQPQRRLGHAGCKTPRSASTTMAMAPSMPPSRSALSKHPAGRSERQRHVRRADLRH